MSQKTTDEKRRETGGTVEAQQNKIYRDALERIFRSSDTTFGQHPRVKLGILQGVAEKALGDANRLGSPGVEYWVEPIPGGGGRVPPFKAANREAGLNFIRNNPLYQLRPKVEGNS